MYFAFYYVFHIILLMYFTLCIYNLIFITLFFVTDDYKVAQKKANKARITNDLSSNNEKLHKKSKHKIKKKNIPRNKSNNENDLSSEICSDVDDIIYPSVPINRNELTNSE